MTRLLTAAVLVPLAWYLGKRAPYPVFLAAALLTIAAASWESFALLEARGSKPLRLLGLILCVAVAWTFAGRAPLLDAAEVLAAAAVVAPLAAMWRRAGP